uniref:Uncharacterized protein n=1 Tax=Arundo donax TaxID=35708 RepID=A0A0A9FID8_ARUDO
MRLLQIYFFPCLVCALQLRCLKRNTRWFLLSCC